jgi:hypothetical protein
MSTTNATARTRADLTSGVDRGTTGGDLGRLVVRALRREGRRLDALFVNIALPVGIMVVFVYVFGGAITTGSSGLNYIDFVVPAVLLLPAALTAADIAADMNGGMIDRLRTLPITSLVETGRALLLDQPIGNAGWIAAAWLAVAVAISVPTAAVLFRRRTSLSRTTQ